MEHDNTEYNLVHSLVNRQERRFTDIRTYSGGFILLCFFLFVLPLVYALCSAVNVLRVEIPHFFMNEKVATVDTTYKISRHRPITDDDGRVVNVQYNEYFLDQIDTNVYEYLETEDRFIFELDKLSVREFYFNRVRDVKVRYLVSNPTIFYPYGSIVDSYAIKNVFIPLSISVIFLVLFTIRFIIYRRYKRIVSGKNYVVVRRTNEFETKKFTHRKHSYFRYAAWYVLDLPGGEQCWFLGKSQFREPEGESSNQRFEFRVYMVHPEDLSDQSYYMVRLIRKPNSNEVYEK